MSYPTTAPFRKDYSPRLREAVEVPDWSDAACRGVDPGVFFVDEGWNGGAARARAICAECPIRVECLEYALAVPERWGIWGGLSEPERREYRRNHTKEKSHHD